MLTLFLIVVQAAQPTPELSLDLFGACVDSAGDVNGDEVPDLWVGDPAVYAPADDSRGNAWCVSGKDGSTLLRIRAPEGALGFGWTLAIVGASRDGIRDVAIGCLAVKEPGVLSTGYGRFGISSPDGSSAVHVFSGRDGALKYAVHGSASVLAYPWTSSGAGPALADVGDWNGDGVDDFAIGWCLADGEHRDQGRVQVVSGTDGTTLHTWSGLESHDRFGITLARLPDIDGDGCPDLAAGAVSDRERPRRRPGYVSILSSKGSVLRTLRSTDGSPQFGASLSPVPRSTTDGLDELVVGQPYKAVARDAITRWNLADGKLLLGIARPTLTAWEGEPKVKVTDPSPTEVETSFAMRLLAVADRDGDGKADVVTTVPQSATSFPAAVLSSQVRADGSPIVAGRIDTGGAWISHSHIGIGLCAAGDFDLDGVDEIAISGCSIRCGNQCTGAVLIVSGKTLGVLKTFTRAGRE